MSVGFVFDVDRSDNRYGILVGRVGKAGRYIDLHCWVGSKCIIAIINRQIGIFSMLHAAPLTLESVATIEILRKIAFLV